MLFEPLRLNQVTLPNRIVLPAMVTRLSGEDGHVKQDILDRYVRFAQGEPGLIVVEAMAVHDAKSGPLLRICADDFIPGLTELARRVHSVSASKVVPQIIHFLKIARSGWRQTIDMLGPDDLRAIVDAYGAAAVRARKAGYDGVELHMAHAYTLSSFLSRLNPRRDAYGGSLENRLRLPSEVLARVRREVGTDFLVGVRFLGEECIKNGATWHDTARIAERFAQLGADYLSLSAGGKFEDAIHRPGEVLYPYTGYSGDRCMPGANYPDGANLYLAANIRSHLRAKGITTPVVATGKIGTHALAEHTLQSGQADLVGMARALLADPDLPGKWRGGREEDAVRCVYGNVCKALDENFKRVVCTLWPKGELNAPGEGAHPPVDWGEAPFTLAAETGPGRASLRWQIPAQWKHVYGYELFRAEGAGELAHYASIRGMLTKFEDRRILGGETYRYQLRPYDFAGRRGPASNIAELATHWEIHEADPPDRLRTIQAADEPGACVAGGLS